MPRISLDNPFSIFATETPLSRGERSPLDIMVETAANEEQKILAARYNPPGQAGEVSSNDQSQDYTKYLTNNQHLNFVQRVLEPEKFPRIDNPDGSYSTHLMASAGVAGKEIAFPTIIQGKEGKLQKLSMDEAVKYALANKEYIEFPTHKEADAFASGEYKKAAQKIRGKE